MFTAPLPFLLGWLVGLLSLTLLGGGLLVLYAWYAGELVRSHVKRASWSRRATTTQTSASRVWSSMRVNSG
jgi:hypothetical protein